MLITRRHHERVVDAYRADLRATLAQRGGDTGQTCVVCGTHIFGSMRGMGDGDGDRYAHSECYWRRESEKLGSRADATAEAHRQRVTAALAERDAARADQAHWRDTAREALKSIAELQRRYAPPAPIEGDVAQPPSVEHADRQAVTDARNPEDDAGARGGP